MAKFVIEMRDCCCVRVGHHIELRFAGGQTFIGDDVVYVPVVFW